MSEGSRTPFLSRKARLAAVILLGAALIAFIALFHASRLNSRSPDKQGVARQPSIFTWEPVGLATYRVGPGEQYRTVSEIAERLQPGETVEITGDISDDFVLTHHGTRGKPIIIRGRVRIVNGRIIRPKVKTSVGNGHGIICRGDWNVLEGLTITGAVSDDWEEGTAIRQESDNLVIRNCRVTGNKQGMYTWGYSGSTLIEFCEFESNGGVSTKDSIMHSVYASPRRPGSLLTVRHCFFHDATGGTYVKSRSPRNVIAYNWFENQSVAAVYLVDSSEPRDKKSPALYPMHSDIVGNVFLSSTAPGQPKWKTLHLGAESQEAAGTEGEFNVAHNLFLVSSDSTDPSAPVLVNGSVDRVRLYNNVFMGLGAAYFMPYQRGGLWEAPRTADFVRIRGSGEPILEGANNWVSTRALQVPDFMRDTIVGSNPLFEDGFGFNYRPRKDSPLCGAGLWPLPEGQMIDLAPEYEPQRGIPPDLKPKFRRKLTPPSIGPFEVRE